MSNFSSRLLFLDTETTGLDIIDNDSKYPNHRITEIAVVELIDGEITSKKFHTHLNPERPVSAAAYRITGLSYEFLKNKPKFEDIVDEFLSFICGGKLIIHNAKFDLKFLNFELSRLNKPSLDFSSVIDTLLLARSKYPGQKASLDALCKKFNIDNSNRVLHGALLDAQLLARVYLSMENFAHQFNLLNALNDQEERMVFDKNKMVILEPTEDEILSHLNCIEKSTKGINL